MRRLILLIGLLLITAPGFAQTSATSPTSASLTPQQYVVSLATTAPHRPVMEKDSSGTDVFHGGLVEYKHEVNEQALQDWIAAYPQEVQAYKISIQAYITTHTNTVLTGTAASVFADLKAQWVMIAHILDVEVYSN